ncbi:hypothetical protein [Micromonospora sp. NPDC092111]|uniref:hypothetical protein n=1 Tax=Micromonospora sp. NPDC092111 TaxID=3364289 RepID=UPI0038252372
MAATDALWWQVWGSWSLLWSATALCWVGVALLLVGRWRTHRRRPRSLDVAFYLNTKAIMGMYQQLRYKPALERAVREEITRSTNAEVRAAFAGLTDAALTRQVDRNVFHEYIEKDEPITVVGIIMDVLEKAGDVAYVDLERQTVTLPPMLARDLSRDHSAGARGAVRLRDLDQFVLIRGVYRKGGDDPRTLTFQAPYGEPDDPSAAPRVRVDCDDADLRFRVPNGPFRARCLGRVENWDDRAGEIVIDPLAIFK